MMRPMYRCMDGATRFGLCKPKDVYLLESLRAHILVLSTDNNKAKFEKKKPKGGRYMTGHGQVLAYLVLYQSSITPQPGILTALLRPRLLSLVTRCRLTSDRTSA